jgi:serine/threonine protein kinase
MYANGVRTVRSRLLNCLQEDGKLFLVFEFVDKDMKRFMEHKLGSLDPALIKGLLYQLLRGLAFSHSRGIMHRYVVNLPIATSAFPTRVYFLQPPAI